MSGCRDSARLRCLSRGVLTVNLQIIGLFYDAAGVVTLGVSSLFSMITQIKTQTGTYWNYNPELAKAFSYARIDTATGSLLLLIGFSIQITSLLDYRATHLGSYLSFGGLAFFFVCYWAFLRAYLSNSIISRVAELHRKEDEGHRKRKAAKSS